MWKYNQTDELYHNAWEYNNPDELYHYGVVGMRWRIRKINKALKEYRKAGKKYESLLNKYNKNKNDSTKLAKAAINAEKKYNIYKKITNKTISSFKKNNIDLRYDFKNDQYYGVKKIKKSKKAKLIKSGIDKSIEISGYNYNKK